MHTWLLSLVKLISLAVWYRKALRKTKALKHHQWHLVTEMVCYCKRSGFIVGGLIFTFSDDDADFCASESESDDEVTIEREEAVMKEHHEDVREEVSALNKDADQDMDDFLASVNVCFAWMTS